MYKLAYIDEDKAWINTFYQTFKDDFEIQKIIVTSRSSVSSILGSLDLENLDAIVTDYLLEESGEVSFNGNKIIEELKRINPYFPVVMLTSYTIQAINQTDDVHIIYSKDILTVEDEKDEEELDVFRKKIQSNIFNYYKKIDNTNLRIEELVEKRKKSLTMSEEEELTKLFILLDELNPSGKDLPANLIDRSSISKLNELVDDAKEILEKIKKIKK